MKCASFQDLVFEYLDGELSKDEQALVTAHLAGCAGCRRLFERENAAGARVRKAFQERTAELRLSAGFKRRVLEALEAAPPPAATTFDGFLAIARRFAWAATMGAAAVVVAAVLLIRGHTTGDAARQAVQTDSGKGPAAVPVQVALVSAFCTSRVEGDQMVDLLEYQTNVVEGAILVTRN